MFSLSDENKLPGTETHTGSDASALNTVRGASSDSPLLSDFVQERYLPFAQETKRSWKADERNLDRHILPHLGAYRLNSITTEVLMDWTNTLKLTGLTYSSCFRMFWLLKYVLNCAVRWGVLSSDTAFKAANLPTKPGRKPVLLNSVEVLQLLDVLKNYRHRASANAIHLMLLTGASKSEILHARWEDVDFEKGTLFTDHTFTGRPHLIPLNNEALKLIQKLPRRDDVPWLFFTRNGTRLAAITREWYEIRELFGHPELRLQDLRHSFANFLVSIGINQRDLRGILGHYKPETLALVRRQAIVNAGGKA